jgi:hypothetical protein
MIKPLNPHPSLSSHSFEAGVRHPQGNPEFMAQFTLGDDRISFQLLQKSQISQFFGRLEQIGIIDFHTSMATYVNLRTFLNAVHRVNS